MIHWVTVDSGAVTEFGIRFVEPETTDFPNRFLSRGAGNCAAAHGNRPRREFQTNLRAVRGRAEGWASWSVTPRKRRSRCRWGDGPTVADSSFEAGPAVQVHRKARTSSDNGFCRCAGMTGRYVFALPSTSLRAKRSNPCLNAGRDGLLRCARNDEERTVSKIKLSFRGVRSTNAE